MRKGQPSTKKIPIKARFEKFVLKTDSCWLWTGALDANGYGRFSVPYSRSVLAHRMSYELYIGPLPSWTGPNKHQLDHICRTHNCVNPSHVEVVTSWENSWRGNSPNAMNLRKKNCIHGHEFTPDNTYFFKPSNRSRAKRHCRECKRLRERKNP